MNKKELATYNLTVGYYHGQVYHFITCRVGNHEFKCIKATTDRNKAFTHLLKLQAQHSQVSLNAIARDINWVRLERPVHVRAYCRRLPLKVKVSTSKIIN